MGLVLVVDDDPDIRQTLADVLELGGHRVQTAENGRVGLDAARREAPDVIILDLMMPVMSGWEFLKEHHRDPGIARVPVIVISAASPGPSLEASEFLPKPFDVDQILAAVERWRGTAAA